MDGASIARVVSFSFRYVLACVALTSIGCSSGSDGPPPLPGTVSGTVTVTLNGAPLEGAAVAFRPAVSGLGSVVTAGDGTYSADVPPGAYTLTFSKPEFSSATAQVTVASEATTPQDAALEPDHPVLLAVEVIGDPVPGGAVEAAVTVTAYDGSSPTGYSWTQSGSVAVAIGSPGAATTSVTFPSLAVYKAELFDVIAEPPLSEADLPPGVELPEGEFPGGLVDRFAVQGVNPFHLDETGRVPLRVEVATDIGGPYSKDVSVVAALPFRPSTGLPKVPIGIPVLLHGKDQGSYDWALAKPFGSLAVLAEPTGRNPHFTPDLSGLYVVTVTDRTGEEPEAVRLEIYAGTWQGAITGVDDQGRPFASGCGCHSEQVEPWRRSGHAQIFASQLDTSTHYGTSCFPCHTVGYDPEVSDGGIDEASDYEDFLAAGLINSPGDNWKRVARDFPQTARKANVQCENCHGPQLGDGHTLKEVRVSLSSDVCATCHGEPPRHGRFQQWQLSKHANYDLAGEEATVEARGQTASSCGRCHSVQGFLAWISQVDASGALPGAIQGIAGNATTNELAALGLTEDRVHPVTCVACHDPHDPGSSSGKPNAATVRIDGDTPTLPAGFRATKVGKGAICMTCHNSRNGAHDDAEYAARLMDDRAPHVASQADVLMGRNAFFVQAMRSPHANIANSCTNCHMVKTPPPAVISYERSGTNHTFAASPESCSGCHEGFTAEDAEGYVSDTEGEIEKLAERIGAAVVEEIAARVAAGFDVYLVRPGTGTAIDAVLATITGDNVATVQVTGLVETGGRMAASFLVEGAPIESVRLSSIRVDTDGNGTADPTDPQLIAGAAGQVIVKAGWNYWLLHGGAAGGVHNPGFTSKVIEVTRAQLPAPAIGEDP